MSTPVLVSRAPVGSSQRRTFGFLARARAMATRCCWPPDSWAGKLSTRSARSTNSRAFIGFMGLSAIWVVTSTFSLAVRVGIRCKTEKRIRYCPA